MLDTRAHPRGGARRHRRLREILEQEAVIRSKAGIRLVSGADSTVYFNVKRPLLDGEAAALIADEILDRLAALELDLIGGMALGAVPIVAAVCARSFPERPLRGFFVRKEVKGHGTQSLIEGYFEKGAKVVLLEDVTTTGGSTLAAAKTIREHGGRVSAAITIIDRLEGSAENLAAAGITLIALFTKDDFRV